MKKILSLLLCFCVITGLLPVFGVFAASPESDFTFDAATGTVTGYTGLGGDVEIPSTIGGTAVTAIGHNAFYNCSSLTAITIPDGVTSIGNDAFAHGHYGLTSITIPDSVTSIGDYAFAYCYGLTSLTLPAYVTEIRTGTFENCNGLINITIPAGVTSIGDYAFCYCEGLTDIIMPDSVTSIGYAAFYGCINLTDITIPAGVTAIGEEVFAYCTGLISITFHSRTAVIYDSEDTIPAAAKIIGHDPSTAKDYAVKYGRTFELIDSPESDFVFDAATGTVTGYTGPGGDVEIPAAIGGTAVTSIGGDAFSYCDSLTGIIIPDGVVSIGYWAFSYCPNLTAVTIPGSVASIDFMAFSNCPGLTAVILSGNVTFFGAGAFSNCNGLESILVQSDNTVYKSENNCLIEISADKLILGCKTSIIPDYITSIGDEAFNGSSGLTGITIPDSVTSIGKYAFSNCIGLTGITIPDGITSIESNTFNGCNNLTSITIPDSITSIGNYAFSDCSGLTSITIPENVNFIGNGAFSYCTGLTGITIPDGITSIAYLTFFGCTGLTSVTIPGSVSTIENDAFNSCSGLTGITIPGSVTFIGFNTFDECNVDLTIYGIEGSYAQAYAIEHSINFVAVSDTPVITVNPEASAITYGQTLADSMLTGGEASVEGSFTWTDGSIAPAVSDSGTTLYGITFTPADGSYENVTSEISVTVEKAIPVILLDDYNAVYNGNIIEIKNAEVILVNDEKYGGSVSYTYYTDQACTKLTQRISGAAVPGSAPKNSGIYFVKAGIEESDNYTAAVSGAARLTISLFRPVAYYRIIATAGTGGSISPSDMAVLRNSLKIFIITPDKGYEIADVSVDGVSVGNVWYYIFYNVTSDHTIHAVFKPVK